MIAFVVHLPRMKLQHVGGTCHHAQVAAFASLGIDNDGSLKFCHNIFFYFIRNTFPEFGKPAKGSQNF